jgi:hypothetical protein
LPGSRTNTFSRQTMRSLRVSTASLNQSQATLLVLSRCKTCFSSWRASALRPARQAAIAWGSVSSVSITILLNRARLFIVARSPLPDKEMCRYQKPGNIPLLKTPYPPFIIRHLLGLSHLDLAAS